MSVEPRVTRECNPKKGEEGNASKACQHDDSLIWCSAQCSRVGVGELRAEVRVMEAEAQFCIDEHQTKKQVNSVCTRPHTMAIGHRVQH